MLSNSLLKVCSCHNSTLAVVFRVTATESSPRALLQKWILFQGWGQVLRQPSKQHTEVLPTLCSAVSATLNTRLTTCNEGEMVETQALPPVQLLKHSGWGLLLHYPFKDPFTSKAILNEGENYKQGLAKAQAQEREREALGKSKSLQPLTDGSRTVRHSFGEGFGTDKKEETTGIGQLRIFEVGLRDWTWGTFNGSGQNKGEKKNRTWKDRKKGQSNVTPQWSVYLA